MSSSSRDSFMTPFVVLDIDQIIINRLKVAKNLYLHRYYHHPLTRLIWFTRYNWTACACLSVCEKEKGLWARKQAQGEQDCLWRREKKEKKKRCSRRQKEGGTARWRSHFARRPCDPSVEEQRRSWCDALSARAVRGPVSWSGQSNGGCNGIQSGDWRREGELLRGRERRLVFIGGVEGAVINSPADWACQFTFVVPHPSDSFKLSLLHI